MVTRRHIGLCTSPLLALLPLILLVQLCFLFTPEGASWSWEWVPSLGINLSFKLDGLSMLFAGLILGIGFLIQLYSLAYMKGKANALKFRVYLSLFMLAMLGLVLSDNILLLFVFWELTTFTSYLLIGFNHHAEQSRKNALQAMLVTGTGGLAMLAGLILLGEIAGSYELSTIFHQTALVQVHPLFIPSLILILLGAFTKSAQFPFHFWLPGAMAAPTPVSAYLHSATMVKAGIYLLARVSPIYSQTDVWFYSLSIAGLVTAIWTALVALRQTDLKLMLAYSTNTVLGLLTFLLALGTEYAMAAALLFILAHAFYKAALFMVIGTIDKATGTRERVKLAGLKSVLMLSFIAATIAAISKAGIPFSLGFLSKEYVYKAGLGTEWWVVALLVMVNMMIVAMALLLIIKPFLAKPTQQTVPATSVEGQWGLWLPPLLLAMLSVIVPLSVLNWLDDVLLKPATLAMSPVAESVAPVTPVTIKLWQGFNTPLILSMVTLGLGWLMYMVYPAIKVGLDNTLSRLPSGPAVYQWLLASTLRVATYAANMMQQKQLSRDVLLFFTILGLLLLSQTALVLPEITGPLPTFYQIVLACILCAAAITCIFATSRLLAIASLSVAGFVITLVFMIYSAPDVAKTQLLVETLVIVFLALVMRHLPHTNTVRGHALPRKIIHAVVASVIGVCVTLLLIHLTSQPLDTSLTQFFADNSMPGGQGRNVVNVILVDFRAFDTLGEILVVVIAALATLGLLQRVKKKRSDG